MKWSDSCQEKRSVFSPLIRYFLCRVFQHEDEDDDYHNVLFMITKTSLPSVSIGIGMLGGGDAVSFDVQHPIVLDIL